jgi:proteasome lid subunit RPN8/RPN11
VIQIESKHLAEMIAHAREEAPQEACGMLAGKAGRVLRLYRARNADQSPKSFRLDPEQQYRILVDIEDRGLDLVGIYHSHPSSPALPSPTDVERAYDPETIHVLISLADPLEPRVGAFLITEEGIIEEDIAII